MPGAVESFVETDRSYLSNESGSARDDGCTAVTAVLLGQKLIIANVGDSRAVLSRAGHGTLFAVLAAWPGSPGPGLAAVLGSMRSGTGSVTTVRGREAASSALVRRLLDRVSSEARSSGQGPSMGSDRQGGTRSAEAHAQPCHRKRRAVSGGFMGGGAVTPHRCIWQHSHMSRSNPSAPSCLGSRTVTGVQQLCSSSIPPCPACAGCPCCLMPAASACLPAGTFYAAGHATLEQQLRVLGACASCWPPTPHRVGCMASLQGLTSVPAQPGPSWAHEAAWVRSEPTSCIAHPHTPLDTGNTSHAHMLIHAGWWLQPSPCRRTTSPTARMSGPGSRMLAEWWSGPGPGAWGACWQSRAPSGTASSRSELRAVQCCGVSDLGQQAPCSQGCAGLCQDT